MMLRKTIVAGSITLALLTSASVLAEGPLGGSFDSIESQALIEKSPDGFFVSPPIVDNLAVMIVNVYNSAGKQVLNVRSKGEAVELMSAGLPEGDYSYQVKTYYKLDEKTLINGDMQDNVMIRDAGRFSIKNEQMLQSAPEFSEEVSFLDSVIDASLVVAGGVLNTLVSSASAANLTASSTVPTLTYDDTSNSSASEFQIQVTAAADDSSGSWILRDVVGFASPVNPVITINTVEASAIENSWVVESNGNMSWRNGQMFLGSAHLSLGANNANNDFSITNAVPDIKLIEDTSNSSVEWELNGGNFYFITDPDTNAGGSTTPFKVSLSAPDDSLLVGSTGSVSTVANLDVGTSLNVQDGAIITGGFLSSLFLGDAGRSSSSFGIINDTGIVVQELTGTELATFIPFSGNGTPYSYDVSAPNNTLFVASSGNMGLGTDAPSEVLHVQRTEAAARIQLDSIASVGANAPQMIWRRARSNAGAPAAIQAGDNLGAFSFRGHDGGGYTGSRGFINVQATQNWSGTGNGTQMLFQVTQNDTTVPFAAMSILNDGTVVINGSVLNVPDYVFEEDYDLMNLDQLAEYLRVNKHLPGVASAKEVNANGLDLGGSQLSLLEKVEELTLYTLQQHEELKQMDVLKSENDQLKAAHRQLLTAFHAQQEKLEKVDQLEQMVNQLIQSQEGKSVYTSLK